ncbi:MAG: C_GCAxxG_C_C family protein [Spirochaetes bacterium]|nr:C_GCAxxG_C_C family protein [Spirochaetota bacterium]
MTNRIDDAVKMFEEGFICSQAVMAAFAEDFGLDKKLALKIANGFGGGIARNQHVCGAVSGAVMLISLKYGKTESADSSSHERTYKIINRFIDKFTEKNGSINCFELLKCKLPEAKQKGLFSSLCSNYVRDAAEIVDGLLK